MLFTQYRFLRSMHTQLQGCIDLVLPARCPVTGETVAAPGKISVTAWKELSFLTDPMCYRCGVPFSYQAGEYAECADCLGRPPAFDSARAALKYDAASRGMILGFKHGDQIHTVHSFVPWLCRAGEGFLKDTQVLIAPVPLHPLRLIRRRYNQAGEIVKVLARQTGRESALDLLQRKRATVPQGHLSPKDRRNNVKGAFALNPKYHDLVKDRPVILVDDVLTTGATVSECARILKMAGAREVNVLTVARAVKD